MRLVVFEDDAWKNFLPLTHVRAVFELRPGPASFLDAAVKRLKPEGVSLIAREYLVEALKERYPWIEERGGDDVLLLNGLLYVGAREAKALSSLKRFSRGVALRVDGRLAAAWLPEKVVKRVELGRVLGWKELEGLVEVREAEGLRLLRYPWELIGLMKEVLGEELRTLRGSAASLDARVIGDPSLLMVGEDSFIEPGVVVDVRRGPVYLGKGVEVEAPSRIVGPAFVGDGSTLFGARVEASVIGEVCRIGGEVSHSILHGYSNKRHYGFLGHSYVGEWVNLGAGFTNSNLKNTYGNMRMKVRGEVMDTGRRFLGCFIGDHVKASIGALVYGGKRVGVSSHIYGLVAEDVPSFTHYARSLGQPLIELEFDSALKTACRMMARRNVQLSRVEENLLRKVYELTERERREAGVTRRRISPF